MSQPSRSVLNLLENQSQLLEAIKKFIENFKKDGADRKTPDKITRKLQLFDQYWADFQANHEILTSLEDMTHPYFTDNQYQVTKQFYQSARQYVQSFLTQEEKPLSAVEKQKTYAKADGHQAPPQTRTATNYEEEKSGTFSNQQQGASNEPPIIPEEPPTFSRGTTSRTEEMLRKQTSNFKAFARTAANIILEDINEKWEFEDALKALQSRWAAIDTLHWEIDSLLETKSVTYEMKYNTYELQYNKIKKDINTKMWSVSHREKATPKMDIPTFSGSYQHWTSFKDLFTEAIHANPSLPNAQKMQFLKSKVKGEAEKLIQHLPISSDNYQTCWDILNHRYNNKKMIFTSHIKVLLGLPNIQQHSSASIKKIHDTTYECLHAIKNLGVDTSSWDPLLVHFLSQKLDTETYNDYVESLKAPRELPTLDEFLEFLENKFTSLESSRRKPDAPKPFQHQHETASNSKKFHSYKAFSTKQNMKWNSNNFQSFTKALNNNYEFKCPYCNNGHKLFACKQFFALQPDTQREIIAKHNLCKNCLFDHKGKECISQKTCRVCNANHNTLLHDTYGNMTPSYKKSAAEFKKPNSSTHVSQEDLSEILLATAVIKVKAMDQTQITLRALIDQGSQTSLITEKAAQMLKLPRERCKGVIFGVGAKENNCKGVINITCTALHNQYTFNTNVYIMRNLINSLPNKSFRKPSWEFLENIQLADPSFYDSRPVDILLGADVYSNIIQEGIIRQEKSQPIAQQTRLGWILCGNVQTLQCNVVINNIDDIKHFWTVEDIAENSNMSQEDLDCLKYYKNTTTRNEDGRYVVSIPFKPDVEEKLGESKPMAIAQFRQLERKFSRKQSLAEAYKQFMTEYEALNHMVECTCNSSRRCFLTHHGVERVESITTALRVVFNASAKTSSGFTLNDLMNRGPNLQQDLMSLILRWRQYPCAITADIEKMYRQILISPHHQQYQTIIWRSSPQEAMREYQLTTVTYGTKAAPFLAMMTLKQLSIDEGHKYPASKAAKALQEDFYMDDLVSGSFTLSSAKQLKTDLIQLLQSGGFNLRKWSSNKIELLESTNTTQNNQEAFDFKQSETTKTLGLKWHPQEDHFTFQLKINASEDINHTKRTLLSDISKIFDPLGWLSPLTTKLKLLFKQVWLSNIKWDEQLPKSISEEWDKIRADLQIINEYKIPRWYQSKECDNIHLHGFCDSSIKAYACVVYCKIRNTITLVAAKTRLVPENKNLTLPRMELCGALLLAKLMNKIKEALIGHQVKVFGWTDSTAVLGWIQGDSGRWKPFVANRVKQIAEAVSPNSWRYVKSAENPADCASRGISGEQLKQHHLWWKGPAFLSTFNEQQEFERPVYVTDQETRETKQSNVTTARHYDNDVIQCILNKYSNLTRAVRVLAWVLRIITRHRVQTAYLTVAELQSAKHMIIKYVQQIEFKDEINSLKTDKSVQKNSKILSLSPYVDANGLLRVGGRIKHANISENMKHPLILPHQGRLTELIIDHAHRTVLHGGARLTLSDIRQNYWILGGNRAVKKTLQQCVTCKKIKAKKLEQLMGDLPESRINPSRPFYHTGVDFTGYVDVKLNKGRRAKTTKGYIAVFVCMATKAVHLELVSDLTSSAFLAALKRMSSRRGKPGHIYSDNGTNFVGANTALQKELTELQQVFSEEFVTEINEMQIQWHFNVPAWPSAGGIWESAVRNLKHHLRRVVGEQKLTYEEYYTLLTQIEGCMNSRPLCAITEDPDDLNYLTPSHFLSSGPVLTIFETETDERTRWHRVQKIQQDLWKRWQAEYLCQLTARSKWKQQQANLKINDVVIIHEPNLPSGKWALGRVIQLHPGADGHVRVVTLKTKSGCMKRPVVKLALLSTDPGAKALMNQSEENINIKNNEAKEYKKQPAVIIKPKENTRTKQTKAKTVNFSSMFISLIFFMATVSNSTCYYNTTKLTKALYLDQISSMQVIRDEWKLIVYYDMNPYWDGLTTLDKYLKQIHNICEKIESKTICDIILLQLSHSQSEMQFYNRLLLNQRLEATRKRRGLVDGVGYIANSLFGVLDQRFADQYQKDITLVRENQEHLALLWKNQTSVVEAEYNLLKRTEATINLQHKSINKHLNRLSNATNKLNNEVQNIQILNELALATIIANNILMKLKSIQDTLLDTITDIHHGMFNIHLLSPDQLRDELNRIAGQLSEDLSLPMNNIQAEIAKIYHLLKVRARVTEHYLIFEIRIPLVNRERFELYKIITIPHQTGNMSISVIPISDYIAINLRKDTYLAITENDIQQCLQYDESTRLCRSQKPVFHFKSDESLCIKNQITNQCQANIAACRNKWMELNKQNSYLYYCCDKCTLRIICEDQVTAVHAESAGVIALSQSCVIKGEDFTVFSHKNQHSEIKTTFDIYTPEIAQINHIINVSVPLIETNLSDNKETLEHIKNQIQQMKTETALKGNLSSHDVHQFTVIYLIAAGSITAAAYILYRRARKCRRGGADLQAAPEARRSPSIITQRPTPQAYPRTTKHGHSSRQAAPTSIKMKNLSNIHGGSKQHRATSPVFQRSTIIDSD